jgi:hypothetical protein
MSSKCSHGAGLRREQFVGFAWGCSRKPSGSHRTVTAMSVEHPQTTDPDGRTVVFDAGSRLHLARRRPWLLDHVDTIMGAIARPDFHSLDPTAPRERFYRQHIEPRF